MKISIPFSRLYRLISMFETKKQTVITSLFLSLSTFVGGIIIYFISSVITDFMVGMFIALTLGMLIYIAFVELLGQMIHSENKKITLLGTILGVGLFLISFLLG